MDFLRFFRRGQNAATASARSRSTSTEHLGYLRSAGYPAEVVAYFEEDVPGSGLDEGDIRFGCVEDMRIENEDAVPGCAAAPAGYLNIASTVCGDCYCIDTNSTGQSGLHPVVLVSHDEVDEDMKPEEVREHTKRVCESFQEFLDRFYAHSLPTDYYDVE